MNQISKSTLTALALVVFSASVWSQSETAVNTVPTSHTVFSSSPSGSSSSVSSSTPSPVPAQPLVTAADVQALRDTLAAQQQQIQRLTEQLQQQQAFLDQHIVDQHIAANGSAQVGMTPASAGSPEQVAELGNGLLQQANAAGGSAQDREQTFNKQMEGPLTIHFRGINITPGGYSEAAFVRRSRALAADLPTPFNSVTLPGASQSQLSEFFGSGRQSKITAFVDGKANNVSLSSYVSADFLSAGVTSTSNQTNGYTLRLRQAWGQVKLDNGWSFLGGQEWSLVTENGKGISPDDDLGRTNDSRPKTIDPSYNVGFIFARQYGIRMTKSFGDKIAVAFALENPQATLTTHGNAANFLLGETGASNSYNSTANYSFNPSPDLVAKVAFDPGFGHYEVFGLYDRFTDRIFPCNESVTSGTSGTVTVSANCPSATDAGTAAGAYNASKNGGGVGASARWNIARQFTVGLKGFGGSGVGRYGPAGLPDVSISADGTIHPIKNLMGLSTIEWHSKRLDIYGYGGVEYAARSYGFDPLANKGAGAEVGYGAPLFNNTGCYAETVPTSSSGFAPGSLATCAGDSRAVVEGTAGFWYRFYTGPRGRFQFGTQYSYLVRNTWSGAGGLPAGTTNGLEPHGIDNMVFTSFRYYLP